MGTKKEMLLAVKNDFAKMLENRECRVIDFCRYNGGHIGIGNAAAQYKIIEYAIQLLNEELEKL